MANREISQGAYGNIYTRGSLTVGYDPWVVANSLEEGHLAMFNN